MPLYRYCIINCIVTQYTSSYFTKLTMFRLVSICGYPKYFLQDKWNYNWADYFPTISYNIFIILNLKLYHSVKCLNI